MAAPDATSLRAAVEALYGAPGPDQERANAWLNAFSRRSEAWDACLELLSPAERADVSFFAAAMLLAKARAEWHKLSESQKERLGGSIRCVCAAPRLLGGRAWCAAGLWCTARAASHVRGVAVWEAAPVPLSMPQCQVSAFCGIGRAGEAGVAAAWASAGCGRGTVGRACMCRVCGAVHGHGGGRRGWWWQREGVRALCAFGRDVMCTRSRAPGSKATVLVSTPPGRAAPPPPPIPPSPATPQ